MIEVKSPAKINLYLNIISKLDNGYHEIESAFQIVDLCDVIKFYPNSDGIRINSNEDIKLEENIIFKAAHSLNSFTNQNNSVQIELDKKIPLGAGLGGGSSNAASTLIALNKIWDLNLKQSELMRLGKNLGSDVPFFINGKNLDFNNFPEGKDNLNQNIQFVNIKLIDKHYFKIDGHLNKLGHDYVANQLHEKIFLNF